MRIILRKWGSNMPTILRVGKYRFHFYSNEGIEPPHIHVDTSDGKCKFWLNPVELARSTGLSATDLRNIQSIVIKNENLFKEKFYEYHGR